MKRINYTCLIFLFLFFLPFYASAGTTIAIFMAGANDLERFTTANLNEIKALAVGQDVTIFVQLENRKGTFRYMYENNNLVLINHLDPLLKPINNTGDPQTVIDFAAFCIRARPGNDLIVVFWDHGTGPLEPYPSRAVEFDDLCTVVTTRAYHLFKRISDPFFIELPEPTWKGLCFDDRHKSFITESKLDYCLKTISQILGKKIDMVIYDTCLEANVSTAYITARYANYMCASEEVVLARGINYTKTFTSLCNTPLTMHEFARNVVRAYEDTYKNIFHSYTFSAFDLQFVDQLEENINALANLLIQAIKEQHKSSVIDIIKTCRSSRMCTSFDQTDYIDLADFYTNLLKHVNDFQMKRKNKSTIQKVSSTLKDGLSIIKRLVIASGAGPKKARAQGISIYFPHNKIHPSYKRSLFAQKSNWISFLITMLN